MEPNGGIIERYVRGLEGTYFLQREVAKALDCSVGLLVKLREEDPQLLGPSFAIEFQGAMILLYTPEDAERLREQIADRLPHLAVDATPDSPGQPGQTLNKMGRPALFTREEAHERQNRHSKAGYWKAQAAKYHHRQEHELAEAAQARADAIRARLKAEHIARAAGQSVEETVKPDLELVVG